MAGRYDQAELLVALWKLGAGSEMMPTSHGILDRALADLKEQLPPELASLTFAGGVGTSSMCRTRPGAIDPALCSAGASG